MLLCGEAHTVEFLIFKPPSPHACPFVFLEGRKLILSPSYTRKECLSKPVAWGFLQKLLLR